MSEWCQKCGTYHDITTAGGCPYKEDKLWVGTYAEGFRAGQESAERRTEAPEAEYREERAQRQLAEARCVALEAENGRLQEALHEAATSLETISKLAGRDEMLEDMMQIRGYANSRARVAFAGLDAAPVPQEQGKEEGR